MSAAIPHLVQKTGRSNSSTEAKGPLSHGRGGAGNMGTAPADFDPPNLETPTLKSEVYTTGRGGSGNMAKNVDAEIARRAQDVVGHPRRESNSSAHVGRGGGGNIFHPSTIAAANANGSIHEHAIDSDDGVLHKAEKGWADRGKDWLLGKN